MSIYIIMCKGMAKGKSPVKLRRRKLQNGNSSLYLDIYADGKRVREFLKLYLIQEKTQKAREQNKKTLEVAETIKAERVLSIQSSKSVTLKEAIQKEKHASNGAIAFVEFMEKMLSSLKDIRTEDYIRRYKVGIDWVRKYDSAASLADIDKEWLQGFIHFLSHTKGKHGKFLNPNTQHEYLIYVANMLNIAVRKGYIPYSPTKYLSSSEKPKKYETRKSFLVIDEIKKLMSTVTPERYTPIRNAFLFSCFTGLRYSDLLQLKWKHIIEQDSHIFIYKSIQKTKEMLQLPLNDISTHFLPDRQSDNSLVFDLPKSISTTEMYVRIWAEFAGIKKDVTFHTARHTFAVSILSRGGDIYTLSKLLGHKNVSTTQIYADIVEESKQKTMNLLDTIPLEEE